MARATRGGLERGPRGALWEGGRREEGFGHPARGLDGERLDVERVN